jgi:hypothetical protein
VIPKPSAQWEMVIPKMARPMAAPVRQRIAEAPEPLPEPAPAEINFAPALLAKRPSSYLGRHGRWMAVVLVGIIGTGIAMFVRPDADAARGGGAEESSISGGWTRSGLSAPGRVVSVYDPSRTESDYRVEFTWVPDALGIGWLFRIQDSSNYYGARLSQLQPGASSALVLEHFEVVGGVEGAHSRKVITQARGGTMVRIRMDVAGPGFTMWAQGNPADYWTDARMPSGPFGFYDERGQRPSLQTVRFTFFKKGAARVAVTSFR